VSWDVTGAYRRGEDYSEARAKNGAEHHDLGADHFNRRSAEQQTKRLVAKLTRLGFEVTLQPTAEAA